MAEQTTADLEAALMKLGDFLRNEGAPLGEHPNATEIVVEAHALLTKLTESEMPVEASRQGGERIDHLAGYDEPDNVRKTRELIEASRPGRRRGKVSH